jgi:hypothetical protein
MIMGLGALVVISALYGIFHVQLAIANALLYGYTADCWRRALRIFLCRSVCVWALPALAFFDLGRGDTILGWTTAAPVAPRTSLVHMFS